ncbi:hypothetical protein Thein_0797 [Thermodesulfatator indicus DSM 15286]|uniref:TIGR04219 family outer membrane beta-barrel protein n=1 Tax=Thermodesulfatator indicus (strain DSM 15286 / JCM 11887 / CIR29812) TaxID=667014 RepID=F8ACH4_THEID|nr:TIGR04219 family outer membrane beta-barrel protein [Thermodesulfatator indicus]AEH44675.1 hypothetical protein Thein_0797 [Thermodesulfatator indicus DSM 15286]
MTAKKLSALIFILVLFLGTRVWAFGLEAAGGFWSENPSGDISYKGDSLSVKDDLRYDTEYKPFGRVKIDLPLINFYLAYTPVNFEEEGELNKTFTFGDKTFNANVPFDSYLKMQQYDLGVYWGIPFLKSVTEAATLGFAGINVELGLNARVMNVEAGIEQQNLKEDTSFTVVIPLLYGGLSIDFGKVSLEGEFRGIAYNNNHYYDAIGRLKFYIFSTPLVGPSAFVGVGYRYQDLKFDVDDFKGTFTLSGPFAELGVNF